VLVVCGCLIAALTLFFRVDHVVVSGQQRYSVQEIQEASGIQTGDNLLLLNKYDVAARIRDALPYVDIEDTRIYRRLPDTLLIEVAECGTPVVVVQETGAWLISSKGKVVEQIDPAAAVDYAAVTGCTLLAPAVGTELSLASEYAAQQESLLALLEALGKADMMDEVDAIHLDDPTVIRMEYIGRFTVKLPYGADYETKLRLLRLAVESDYVQDNMTGTFDMTRPDGRTYLDQSVR